MRPEDVTRSEDRVAVFVDAANTEASLQDLGYQLDWARTLAYFRGGGRLAGAYYFVARRPDDDGQRHYLDEVAAKGFVVRAKDMKAIEGGGRKGNLDVELAIEMLATADHWDVAYLLSGDSDFRRLVEVLQARGKRVHVVASRDALAWEMLHVSNKPVPRLEDLEDELAFDAREQKAGAR